MGSQGGKLKTRGSQRDESLETKQTKDINVYRNVLMAALAELTSSLKTPPLKARDFRAVINPRKAGPAEAGIDNRKFEQLLMHKNLDPISGANVSTIGIRLRPPAELFN